MPASDVGAPRGPSRPRVTALAALALHRGAAGLMLVLAVLAALVFCRESFAAEPGDVTSGALMMRAKRWRRRSSRPCGWEPTST
jgi:Ca-activated chloride channel family protein